MKHQIGVVSPTRHDNPWLDHPPPLEKEVKTSLAEPRLFPGMTQRTMRKAKNPHTCRTSTRPSARGSLCDKNTLKANVRKRKANIKRPACQSAPMLAFG